MKKKQEQSAKVTPISDKLERVEIAADEQAEVRALNANMTNIKTALGQLDIERAGMESRRAEALQAYSQANKSLSDRVGAIARAHGIDPDADPVKGKWNFDTNTFVFTRVA